MQGGMQRDSEGARSTTTREGKPESFLVAFCSYARCAARLDEACHVDTNLSTFERLFSCSLAFRFLRYQSNTCSSSLESCNELLPTGGELLSRASHAPFSVREAQPQENWDLADMHCSCFYPNAGFLCGPLLRLDRFLSLKVCACRPACGCTQLSATPLGFSERCRA